MVKRLVHLEGLVVLVSVIYLYSVKDFSWWVFLLLLFVPDVAMFAYLMNKRVGAVVYNLFHTYILTIPICLAGVLFQLETLLMIGLIWTAHVGMDRFVGYGLKYQTSFQDTHLQRM